MSATPDPFALAADLLDPPVDPHLHDPVAFASGQLGFTAWSKQRDVMRAIDEHDRVAVRACHGVGKTAGAAQIALWFLGTRANSRVITTAPTWSQVEQLLWREIRAAVGRAHEAGQGVVFPKPSATKLEIGDEWFAIGLSTNKPERFQGHHADHLLLIVDEASGVDEKIYEAAEGFLTAEGAKILLIGNPTQLGGQFHRAFTSERQTWKTIHISVFDSPNYTGEKVPASVARSLPRPDWAAEKGAQWGESSPMYQVRVLGNFPASAENAVIALVSVENAQARQHPADSALDQVVISCDVARYGNDETVICERVGDRCRILETFTGQRPPTTTIGSVRGDLVATAARVAHHAAKHPRPHVRIVIDDTGVGGGVTDILRNQRWRVTAFNGSEQAHNPREFPNRRSELWFQVAAQLEDIDLDPDDQLAGDLTAPTYSLDLKGRRVVEAKDETRKRLGRSPDRGDAINLLFVPAESLGAIATPAPAAPAARAAAPLALSDEDLMNQPM